MQSKSVRLDRFISKHLAVKRSGVKALLAQKRVMVDGEVAVDADLILSAFSRVVFDEQVLQENTPRYVMMNKPQGVVSATKDDKHETVIDVLKRNGCRASGVGLVESALSDEGLHIVGRLDFNSTGLLLLTNDGRWSKRLSSPEQRVLKRYRVTLAKPVTQEYICAFNEGMYFEYEDVATRPAQLTIISDYEAEVALCEGRYHQIKRMFGRFQNEVLTLHRFSVGGLSLDESLGAGESRELTAGEVANI